jgi:phosphoglycerate kinase
MISIDQFSFKGLRALIRVDYNVPLNDAFEITDATRIIATIPSVQKILNDGGSVVLMSHLGRPKNGPEDKFSMRHLLPKLEEVFGQEVKFASDCIGEEANELSASLKAGEILLLENLRFYKEESAGDKGFAEKLSKHGDFYVNDAFGTAHRAHASTAIIAQFFPSKKAFGYVMGAEIENVGKVVQSKEKPVTAIIGGAKVSSKITIIENLLPKVDHLIIGGGMAYTFSRALGGETGKSMVEEDLLDTARTIITKAKEQNVQIHLPVDSVNASEFSNEATVEISPMNAIGSEWMGLDVGPETQKLFREVILQSKVILWNGPVGVFEMSRFAAGTMALGEAIVEATEKGAFSLVGGGDSVAAAKQFGMADKVSYVSTGGGAMLEYLEGKSLPGIEAVLN